MTGLRITSLALALVAVSFPSAPAQDSHAGEAVEIKVTAKKYAFAPNPIRVKKGDRVKLVITAVDHDHGFKLDAFQIDQQLKEGETTTVELWPIKPGPSRFSARTFAVWDTSE